jgi:ornithine lipid ester-linked acyl 2-hydroxylase
MKDAAVQSLREASPVRPLPAPARRERPWYYILPGRWYAGAFPQIYDISQVPAAKILKDNYPVIRREIMDYFAKYGGTIEPTFTPYAYKEAGWRMLNLYSMFMRYGESCARLPETTRIVESIPGMCSAQVALLYPRARVRPHFADTSAFIRTHIGIQIPGTLPDIGMRVKKQVTCWKEGEAFSFCPAHRHYTWNRTQGIRIMLQVDTMRPEFQSRRYRIGGNIVAATVTKLLATRHPILRNVPRPVVLATHRSLGLALGVFFWLQHRTRFNTADWLARLKGK